jgi:hypothetical protein
MRQIAGQPGRRQVSAARQIQDQGQGSNVAQSASGPTNRRLFQILRQSYQIREQSALDRAWTALQQGDTELGCSRRSNHGRLRTQKRDGLG